MSWWARRRHLEQATREAADDLKVFGEELRRLEVDVADRPLDDPARRDHQRALDAYGDAERSLRAATKAEEIRRVTELLADGRYAASSLQARLAGRPVPQRRPPCFFDPAHGPSAAEVAWAPPGGAARSVQACEADADRVRTGLDPEVRTVRRGSRLVPYWDAGRGCLPWLQGYYASWGGLDLLTGGLLVGSALSASRAFLGADVEVDAGSPRHDRGPDGSSVHDRDRDRVD
jgi:hypothetical protein